MGFAKEVGDRIMVHADEGSSTKRVHHRSYSTTRRGTGPAEFLGKVL